MLVDDRLVERLDRFLKVHDGHFELSDSFFGMFHGILNNGTMQTPANEGKISGDESYSYHPKYP